MDRLLVAASFVVPLTVALAWATWYLMALGRSYRRQPSMSHVFRGQGEAITVAELLQEAVEQGEGMRLNWTGADLDAGGRVRPHMRDEFPTAILPRVRDFGHSRHQPVAPAPSTTNEH
ncbi:MAG: hypothetical protein ACJ72N_11685 [Labedaea sp.]